MRKVSLLFLFAVLCFNISAEDFYLIKDGKLQAGVTYEQWFDEYGMSCALLKEGDGYATLQHFGQFFDAVLQIDESTAFSVMGKNLVVEYQLPAEAMTYNEEIGLVNLGNRTAVEKDKPTLIVSASSGIYRDEEMPAVFDYCHVRSVSYVNIDGKFNPEAEKGFVKYEGYSFAKSSDKVRTVFLGYLRGNYGFEEGSPAMKIKNLYYTDPEGEKPFFSCAFDGTDYWSQEISISDGETLLVPKYLFQDEHPYVILNDTIGDYVSKYKMFYHNTEDDWVGGDGSGYLSCVLTHALYVKSNADYEKQIHGQDITLAFEDVEIPANSDNVMRISCLVREDLYYEEDKLGYTIYEYVGYPLVGDPEKEQLPIYVKFDNGEEIRVFKDALIPSIYTLMEDEVEIPKGAKSVSVYFKQNENLSYTVDNLILSIKNSSEFVPKDTVTADDSNVLAIAEGTEVVDVYVVNPETVTSVVLPKSVTSVVDDVFTGMNLNSLSVESNLELGQAGIESLDTLIFRGTMAEWCEKPITSIAYKTLVVEDFVLSGSTDDLLLREGVETIANGAFDVCPNLNKITLPESVKMIGNNTFSECTSLTEVVCYAKLPPSAKATSFGNYNGYLSIPCDYLEQYDVHVCWGSFKHVKCISYDDIEMEDIVIVPTESTADISWERVDGADSYAINITQDGKILFTLNFDENGKLLNIDFSNSDLVSPAPDEYLANALRGGSSIYNFTVTGLKSGTQYGYVLKAKDKEEDVIACYNGEFSTIGSETFVEERMSVSWMVYTNQLTIFVKANDEQTIDIFNPWGQRICGKKGTLRCPVELPGVYLVKCGEQATKVVVK